MRLNRCFTGVAMAALMAGTALAQTAPQQPAAAGALNPAAESAPTAAPAPAPQFELEDGVRVSVNDAVITGYDVRQRMLLLIIMSQLQPTEENLPAIYQRALEALIEERLQAQELTKFEDLKIDDAAVDREIGEMAQRTGLAPEQYLAQMELAGLRPQTLRDTLRTQIGWEQLVGGRFQGRARPSRAAVDAAMRQIEAAAAKKQYLIGEIYVENARFGGSQQALSAANRLIQELVNGAPFQSVAQQFSSASSAARGGDGGWVIEGSVPPTVQQALDQLQVGQMSRPVPVENGFYVLYLRDKREGASTNLVQMKQVMVEVPEGAAEADVAAATARLEAIRPQLTCDNLLERARSEQGLLGSDLGESDVDNLAPQFQQVARSATVGSVSTPVRTPIGVHLLAVCGRRNGAAQLPERRMVENQLFQQQISVLEKRYMRDLRDDALITQRQ